MQRIAAGWLVWDWTGSAVWLGVLAMGDLLPVVVFGPLAGVAADRADKLVQNMICQLLSSVVATAFALMLVFGWLDLASLLLLVTLQGTLVAVIQPGRLAMVQEMVPRDDLSAAMKDSHSSGSQLP
ncbi:MFS transporter [Pseudomonas putida]|nr:MFS transporter [Pseudomonas putida]UPU92283.1 MFS transporter [Pseudomonas putida]